MQNPFKPGDVKVYHKRVTKTDFAQFESGLVHPVCSTFSLAQAMEWASRLFVLEMKDPDEEGIGTMLHIDHVGPALEGDHLQIEATFQELKSNALTCSILVKAGDKTIATGQTGQKILKSEKIQRLLTNSREF